MGSQLSSAMSWVYDESRNNLNLDNWYTRLQLHSVDHWKIGMIGTSYFIGFLSGSIYFPRIADTHGRKPFVVIGGFLQSICTLLLYFSNSLFMIYLNMFLIGVASPFFASIGYNYLIEFIPKANQNAVNTLLMMFDACGSLFGILYFTYISHNIDYFLLGLASLGFLASIVHLMTPESPIFFLSQRKFDDARTVLNIVSNINGKQFPKKCQFKGEDSIIALKSPGPEDDETSIMDFFKDPTLMINILVMI